MKFEKLFTDLIEEQLPKNKTIKILDIDNDPSKITIHFADGQPTKEDLVLPPNTIVGKGGIIALPVINLNLQLLESIGNLIILHIADKTLSISFGHFLSKELSAHRVKFSSNSYCLEVLGIEEETLRQLAELMTQLIKPGIVMLRNYFDGEIVFIKNLNP